MALKQMQNDDAAQVGIGTMIVFIATILVAAVAAGVLIDTSQKLQDKSTRTGTDAVSDVGSTLQVDAVYGHLRGGTEIREIQVLVSLASGADPVNLQDLVLQYTDGTQLIEYIWYADTGVATDQNIGTGIYSDFTDNTFWIDLVRDSDGSAIDVQALGYEDHVAAADDIYNGVMNEDDVILLRFAQFDNGLADQDLDLGSSTRASISLLPANGVPSEMGFKTPSSFGSDVHFELA